MTKDPASPLAGRSGQKGQRHHDGRPPPNTGLARLHSSRKDKTNSPSAQRYMISTSSDQATWDVELYRLKPVLMLPPFGLTEKVCRPILSLFRTSSCASFSLSTERLLLRQVEPSDLPAIERIKTEPLVNRTQLYHCPRVGQCDEFLDRYVRSSMPRLSVLGEHNGRDAYIFAITLKDSSSVQLRPRSDVRLSNALRTADGYLGNIALTLEASGGPISRRPLRPVPGQPFTHPTFAQASKAQLVGRMFYELHPQVWGMGLMSEAFKEVLRFAMEDVGCTKVVVDPTKANAASIRLCVSNRLTYTHTEPSYDPSRPRLFHEITRSAWFSLNKTDQPVQGKWEGRERCRWCMRLDGPDLDPGPGDSEQSQGVQCKECGWARYCSRECQRADWIRVSGHQAECGLSSPNPR